jgi:hypothetical protein
MNRRHLQKQPLIDIEWHLTLEMLTSETAYAFSQKKETTYAGWEKEKHTYKTTSK